MGSQPAWVASRPGCGSPLAKADGRESRMAAESVPVPGVSRWQRLRGALTPQEWRRVVMLGAVILGLHVVGLFILISLVVPQDFSFGKSCAFGLGIGITAYTLGLRHAFDAVRLDALAITIC